MTIADSKAKLEAVAEYEDFVREMFRTIIRAHVATGRIVEGMNQLQEKVQTWSQAAPGTTGALLYEIHTGIMPTNLNPYLLDIRQKLNALRAAIEDADIASDGQWFGVG